MIAKKKWEKKKKKYKTHHEPTVACDLKCFWLIALRLRNIKMLDSFFFYRFYSMCFCIRRYDVASVQFLTVTTKRAGMNNDKEAHFQIVYASETAIRALNEMKHLSMLFIALLNENFNISSHQRYDENTGYTIIHII